ncbi:VOC family protein [Rehaibacterium terrae]|uniref:Catechol 2,3-dioxygenase-like lactoylglutathione lyase family enzyme n=1 Tax=Rehaibacterium terrae TaxID=1341696 RepID=A0A7W7Y0W5_9GAMM|nr:VOC family protein [Rehaibacterium terrae]MBB5016059.1 catechol 2,3-dioxygenase-like lactoylglutathione lyase family enzyme [Rehaibacterium terrae]
MTLVHHLALTAADLPASIAFYDGLLAHLGCRRTHADARLAVWQRPDFELIVYAARDGLREHRHRLYQPGFHHLALRAGRRDQVDAVHDWLRVHGMKVLDPPREYPQYAPGYYALFFLDPDELKLEVVHD